MTFYLFYLLNQVWEIFYNNSICEIYSKIRELLQQCIKIGRHPQKKYCIVLSQYGFNVQYLLQVYTFCYPQFKECNASKQNVRRPYGIAINRNIIITCVSSPNIYM